MVSNFSGIGLIVRVLLLFSVLSALSLAVINDGFYVNTVLLIFGILFLVWELYHFVNKTNRDLNRFLDAIHYEDFGQRFHSSLSAEKNPVFDAGFNELALHFDKLMQTFGDSRQRQEASLRHLKLLTEHIPVPLLSIFSDDRIQLHNNAARRLFSRSNINKTQDLSRFGKDFFDVITGLKPDQLNANLDVSHNSKHNGNHRDEKKLVNFLDDGDNRQLSIVATKIVTGNISENLISLQDIQSELDLAQLEAWQDLVRVLTHEMMNSITPIISLAKTATNLVDDARDKVKAAWDANAEAAGVLEELDDVRCAVATVARRSDGLMLFVESYRSLTRLPEPKIQTFHLIDIFQQVQRLLTDRWLTSNIKLLIRVEPQSIRLSADPDLIEQLLINLFKNAERAMLACDKPQVELIGRLNQRGNVVIELSDNGEGIPDEIIDKIFIPFFTTRTDGSGVGLALTRQIMIAHGGSVKASVSDQGGAKFTLIF